MHGVGLVRGINVGASTRVAKADLAAAFADAGFANVTTFLQSGNVVFDADAVPTATVAATVEAGIEKRSGVAARVVLLTEKQFRAVAAANPLLQEGDDHSKLMVTFLDHPVPGSLAVPEEDAIQPELVKLGERAVYQWCPLGVSKSKLKPAFWREVGSVATGRNWRTVLRLIEELDARS
ncbi:hypothetical protein ASE16_07805 [Leifsonia sp. Root227]|uniref:DUF1697 domain-containing protein n=1 Tax=Leifsonia sp. Root227 TaxID=1736496 RepID=UPI0006F3C170|nr:DUF1697 domain-containing protein [Leifsonia sp. Root227]KRC50867.1 hypothetical protein ASE16_07805 [Leifsonia sp. Root227]